MKRQTDHEQIQRLSVKTLDQVFIARASAGETHAKQSDQLLFG